MHLASLAPHIAAFVTALSHGHLRDPTYRVDGFVDGAPGSARTTFTIDVKEDAVAESTALLGAEEITTVVRAERDGEGVRFAIDSVRRARGRAHVPDGVRRQHTVGFRRDREDGTQLRGDLRAGQGCFDARSAAGLCFTVTRLP